MAKPAWNYRDLTVDDDADDFVFFEVIGYPKKIRIHKSVLIENSSVFKDAFNEEITNNEPLKPIVIDDKALYDRVQAIKCFVVSLYTKKLDLVLDPVTESTNKEFSKFVCCHQVYYFADKYHVDWLIKECLKKAEKFFIASIKKYEFDVVRVKFIDIMVKKMSLDLNRFKQDTKLCIRKSNVVKFFKYASENGHEEFKDQIVASCCLLDFDPSWPTELTGLVIKRLKEVPKEMLKEDLTDSQLEELVEDDIADIWAVNIFRS